MVNSYWWTFGQLGYVDGCGEERRIEREVHLCLDGFQEVKKELGDRVAFSSITTR
jgi:hypothetical protein